MASKAIKAADMKTMDSIKARKEAEASSKSTKINFEKYECDTENTESGSEKIRYVCKSKHNSSDVFVKLKFKDCMNKEDAELLLEVGKRFKSAFPEIPMLLKQNVDDGCIRQRGVLQVENYDIWMPHIDRIADNIEQIKQASLQCYKHYFLDLDLGFQTVSTGQIVTDIGEFDNYRIWNGTVRLHDSRNFINTKVVGNAHHVARVLRGCARLWIDSLQVMLK